MSIVGPRPLLVKYLPLYNEEQHHRHDVRPGLTGYAQVHGRNVVNWQERFQLDVWYVNNRGSFTELVHTADCGQVSINISKPGITKGQHWHNSKWEQFIVVHGHGLIQERNINTGEMVEFEVSGDKIEAIYMIPGWTHNIINLSDTEDLVTVMTCNEVFDPNHPDTFFEVV